MPRLLVALVVLAAVCLATPALAGARPTAVFTYQPFGANDLKSAIKVTQTEEGECATGSIASPRSDAWRCTAGNEIYDPCFSSSTSGFVVCPEYFSTRQVVRLNLQQPLPSDGNTGEPGATNGLPWGLLARPYAGQCRLNTGMLGTYKGKKIYYTCALGPSIVGKPNRSTKPWTARVLTEGDNPNLYRAFVRIAWF